MGFFDFLRRKRSEDTGSGSATNDPTTATAASDATIGEAGLSEPPGHDAQPDAPDSGGGDSGTS